MKMFYIELLKKCENVYKCLPESERENLAMLFGVLEDLNANGNGDESESDISENLRMYMSGSSDCDGLTAKIRQEVNPKALEKLKIKDSIFINGKPDVKVSDEDAKDFYKLIVGIYHENKVKVTKLDGKEMGKDDEIETPEDADWKKDVMELAELYFNKKYKDAITSCVTYFAEYHEKSETKSKNDSDPDPLCDAFSDITFNIIDSDRSGIIGLKEYRKYVKGLSGNSYSSLRADTEFKMFDTDKSNAIDIQEFREIFKIAVYGFADANSEFIFKQIDTDKNGKISYDEFMAYFEKEYPDYLRAKLINDFKDVTKTDKDKGIAPIRRSINFGQFKKFYDDNFAPYEETKEVEETEEVEETKEKKVKKRKIGKKAKGKALGKKPGTSLKANGNNLISISSSDDESDDDDDGGGNLIIVSGGDEKDEKDEKDEA